MTVSQATHWWMTSAAAEGLSIMDQHVDVEGGWLAAERTGAADFERALKATEMPVGSHLNVLEIGCGAGRITSTLANRFGSVVAVDVSPEFIELARGNCAADNVDFRVVESETLHSVAAEDFDVVFSYEVFHYLEPRVLRRYVAEVHRLLKPGGTLVVQLNTESIHPRTYVSRQVRRVLHRVGIRRWHGWPTAPQFCHKTHRPDWILSTLREVGFNSARVNAPGTRCSWFVAAKDHVAHDSAAGFRKAGLGTPLSCSNTVDCSRGMVTTHSQSVPGNLNIQEDEHLS